MRKIFVVDDEEGILTLIKVHLEKEGFCVKCFEEGNSLFEQLKEDVPDLIILDVMLPGLDGFQILKILRESEEYREIPVIMLTARGEEYDRVYGLESGADDYVTKPFSVRELAARVKTVLKRVLKEGNILTYKDEIVINLETHDVFLKGKKIDLTLTEYNLLTLFLKNPNKVFSRSRILDKAWEEKYVSERTVDVHLKHLRDKLGDLGKRIVNVRGVGYKFEG